MSEYAADLLSDFLRFFPQFGTEPFEVMSGPTFFALAPRIAAYGGVMAYRLQEQAAPAVADRPAADEPASLAAFRAQHPDLVEVVSVGG